VPAIVTIPRRPGWATNFTVNIVDDADADGPQAGGRSPLRPTGFTSATLNRQVGDNDAPPFHVCHDREPAGPRAVPFRRSITACERRKMPRILDYRTRRSSSRRAERRAVDELNSLQHQRNS
jgi:hypothetical protein